MRALLLIMFLIFSRFAIAETHQFYEFRTEASITKVDIFDGWDLNLFTSENANISSKDYDGVTPPANIQNYFLFGPTYKYTSNLQFIFLGYIYQRTNSIFDNFVNENRLFQQISYNMNTNLGIIHQRMRFEQRFIHDVKPDREFLGTRLRYRIGFLRKL